MKQLLVFSAFAVAGLTSAQLYGQAGNTAALKTNSADKKANHYYLDVHHLGKVNASDVAGAHQKDLAVQKKYGVNILKYWIDEKQGDVYCLATAASSEDLRKTHAEAHGLVPDKIFEVTEGEKAKLKGNNKLFLDVHELGAGKVTFQDVQGAHKKDLAIQKKYGVNLIDYWFDEKTGTVMCLAQAPDADALIKTHKEAHGLIPVRVAEVKENH